MSYTMLLSWMSNQYRTCILGRKKIYPLITKTAGVYPAVCLCPHRDSNPGFSLERAASWSPRRWGQATGFYHPTVSGSSNCPFFFQPKSGFGDNRHFTARILTNTFRIDIRVIAQLDMHQAAFAGGHWLQYLPPPTLNRLVGHPPG